MTREVEAIFEDGVFKPVEPVELADKQRVRLRVDTEEAPQSGPPAWKAEMAWIGENAHLYTGEYVALYGGELISHGEDLRTVSEEARKKGVEHPLFHRVPKHLGEPSIDWF